MAEKKTRSAASTRSKAAGRRAASKKDEVVANQPSTQEALAALAGHPVQTAEQKEIASAKKATSKVTAGGTETVDEKKIRMESEGVLTPIKSDFDNPESPVVGDPAGALVGPKAPGPVKLGVGETAAQHEAHTLMSAPEMIAERIERESGPEGLPTDVIAREQQDRVARAEFQRVDGDGRIDGDAIRAGVRDSERPKRGGTPPAATSED